MAALVCSSAFLVLKKKKLNTPRFFGRYTQLERKKKQQLCGAYFFLLSGNVVDVVVGQDRKKKSRACGDQLTMSP